MIITVIYLILSFILDNLMSYIIPSSLGDVGYFNTIYIIISFVIICSYFSNEKKYYLLILIFGLLFDVLYTGTFIFNMIIFVLLGIIIKIFNSYFPVNVFTINVNSIISIFSYHILSFIILNLVSGISYGFITLIHILIGSIVMTIIYTSISYFVMGYIYKRFNIKYIK